MKKPKKLEKHRTSMWSYNNISSTEFKVRKTKIGFTLKMADMEKYEFVGEEIEVIFKFPNFFFLSK